MLSCLVFLVMGSQATPRSSLPSWDGSHHLSPEEGGLPGCSRGGGLQTGLAAWVSLSGFPAQISGTEACYWQNLEIAGGFHCLGLGSPGVGDADDVLVGRGSEKRLGLAIMSVPSSWSSGTRGGSRPGTRCSKASAPTLSPVSADPVSWGKGDF